MFGPPTFAYPSPYVRRNPQPWKWWHQTTEIDRECGWAPFMKKYLVAYLSRRFRALRPRSHSTTQISLRICLPILKAGHMQAPKCKSRPINKSTGARTMMVGYYSQVYIGDQVSPQVDGPKCALCSLNLATCIHFLIIIITPMPWKLLAIELPLIAAQVPGHYTK